MEPSSSLPCCSSWRRPRRAFCFTRTWDGSRSASPSFCGGFRSLRPSSTPLGTCRRLARPSPSALQALEERMRVLLVITKGELGGAQTHVAELCRELRHQCEFLVLIGGSARS